jgi:medium-chain acyl-[acyl-carrier-protein] hydrolase
MKNDASAGGLRLERRLRVQAGETGPEGRIKLGSLLNHFQEAASEHAEKLGASVTDLISKNLTWVLSRYHIKIFRYPLWKESLRLTTWPSVQQGLFALREFEVRDEQSHLLAAATTSWMLLAIRSKRPVPLADNLPEYPKDPSRALADPFGPLPETARADLELSFQVQRRDLDWNRHVNHVVYVEWAVETAPLDILENFSPAEIEVDFRGEALFRETVLSRTEFFSLAEKPLLHHQIVREKDHKELTRLRTFWKKF